MKIDDDIVHIPTGKRGKVKARGGQWYRAIQIPPGQILFEDETGRPYLANEDVCVPDNKEYRQYVKMEAWLKGRITELLEQVCQTDCSCGRNVAGQDEVAEFPCGYCLASEMLEHLFPLAPEEMLKAATEHAQKHIKEGLQEGIDALAAYIRPFVNLAEKLMEPRANN